MQFHLIFICLYYRIGISDDHYYILLYIYILYYIYNIYMYIYIILVVSLTRIKNSARTLSVSYV